MSTAQGTIAGTASSAEALAKNRYRERVTFTMLNAITTGFAFGGNAAALDEGVVLHEIGDTLIVEAELARGQIKVIGNTASIAYQTGRVVSVVRGPNPFPAA